MLALLAMWAQTSPSATPDLIAIYGTAGVPLLGAIVAIRVLWRERQAEREACRLEVIEKDKTIAALQADMLARTDRMVPLLTDALRILEADHAPPVARTRTRS